MVHKFSCLVLSLFCWKLLHWYSRFVRLLSSYRLIPYTLVGLAAYIPVPPVHEQPPKSSVSSFDEIDRIECVQYSPLAEKAALIEIVRSRPTVSFPTSIQLYFLMRVCEDVHDCYKSQFDTQETTWQADLEI